MTLNHRRNKIASKRNRSLIEPLEDRLLMAVFTVTNTNDSGVGSLRWAISQTGTVAGLNTVAFNIQGADKTIRPTSSFSCWSPLIIDATTQPGYAGKPLVVIDGSNAGGADGFQLGGGCTLKGLDIIHFAASGSGVSLTTSTGAGGNTVQANWIGVDLNGNPAANGGHGIGVYTPNNIIGGPNQSDGNVISDNRAYGVFILGGLFGTDAHGNLVQNNTIVGDYNGVGVQSAPNQQILSNLISGSVEVSEDQFGNGNGGDGILLTGSATGITIRGNLIGTDATGSIALPNQQYGIEIQTSGNTVQGNTISGNRKAGIVFYSAGANSSVVKGNYIGTDSTGLHALANLQQGIAFASAGPNQIGSTAAGDGNVVAANVGVGIGIFPGNGENIQGNIFGAGIDGLALPNQGGDTFVSSDSQNNVIANNRGPFSTPPAAPQLQAAVSRHLQGGTAYDIPLPQTGTTGVECRMLTGGLTLVLTFDKAIASASASVTAGSGGVGTVTPSGNSIFINLANVANAQTLTVTLTNIVAADGGTAASAPVTFRVLEGDVNGNGSISAADIALIKFNSGKIVTSSNFRMDLNENGLISASDVNLCKFLAGTSAPQTATASSSVVVMSAATLVASDSSASWLKSPAGTLA